MHLRRCVPLALGLLAAASCAGRFAGSDALDLHVSGDRWRIFNRAPVSLTDSGRAIVRFDERPGAGLAWLPGESFTNGEIEFDVRGRDVPQRSFVGMAFHVAADTTFDVVWLRPFNFRQADPAARGHSVQFASYMPYTWQRLRQEHPGEFEAPVPPGISPVEWIHVRLSVHERDVRVYLNGAASPVLAVHSPSERTSGGIGLFVGDNSTGDFANVRVRRTGS